MTAVTEAAKAAHAVDTFGFSAAQRFERCNDESETFAEFAAMAREVEAMFDGAVGEDLRRRHAYRMTLRGAFHSALIEQRAKNARRGSNAAA